MPKENPLLFYHLQGQVLHEMNQTHSPLNCLILKSNYHLALLGSLVSNHS